jgi:hypothetical protein
VSVIALNAEVQGALALEQELVLLPVSLARLDCAIASIELPITKNKRRKGLDLHIVDYLQEGIDYQPGKKVDLLLRATLMPLPRKTRFAHE